MTKPLTQQEFARLGAQGTNSKYTKEQRSEWAKRGPEALKAKYGEDYLSKRAKDLNLAKIGATARTKKKNKPFLSKLLGLK